MSTKGRDDGGERTREERDGARGKEGGRGRNIENGKKEKATVVVGIGT